MTDKNVISVIVAGVALAFSMGLNAQAMHVAPSGEVGIGTISPAASLHIQRSDSTAQILVEELNGDLGKHILFRLRSAGNTLFSIMNTSADVEWSFANPGTGLRFSRQGSGVVELEVLNNGNMTIAGSLTQNSDVNAKTAITDVDIDEVLNLVTRLPVSKWEYKDARGEPHIGPMAQDFYAAFGLGGTETGISTIDTAGVALVAIQALAEKNGLLELKNQSLQGSIEQLQRENKALLTGQAQLLSNQQQQSAAYDNLKAMVIDLQVQTQSKRLLTSLN